jgi:glyoxylase-like metal-dependent hydrolase (beta-lactamase superfamily II)/ferredoxin
MRLYLSLSSSLIPLVLAGQIGAFLPQRSGVATPSIDSTVQAFSRSSLRSSSPSGKDPKLFELLAKPQRFGDNAPGVVYVNDKCINCAACSAFAPSVFSRSASSLHHVVSHQPETADEIETARAALAACPVAAIRVETLPERRHRSPDKEKAAAEWTGHDDALVRQMGLSERSGLDKPFPRPFLTPNSVPDVYWLGHHNEASFGATPYLLRAGVNGTSTWIMVDTPRFSTSAANDVVSLTGTSGPDYLFLTHVDDTADHHKWAAAFPKLKRIFHSGDLGPSNWLGDDELNHVEIILPSVATVQSTNRQASLVAYSLDGKPLGYDWASSASISAHPVVILHTPGHSPGSITLYKRPIDGSGEPGVLFTGDTYAYTTKAGGQMTGFPRYGNSLRTQSETLQRLLQLDWDVVAPGHGHPRDYRGVADQRAVQARELQAAQEELQSSGRRWR